MQECIFHEKWLAELFFFFEKKALLTTTHECMHAMHAFLMNECNGCIPCRHLLDPLFELPVHKHYLVK